MFSWNIAWILQSLSNVVNYLIIIYKRRYIIQLLHYHLQHNRDICIFFCWYRWVLENYDTLQGFQHSLWIRKGWNLQVVGALYEKLSSVLCKILKWCFKILEGLRRARETTHGSPGPQNISYRQRQHSYYCLWSVHEDLTYRFGDPRIIKSAHQVYFSRK